MPVCGREEVHASVQTYHGLSGLKQHKFIIVYFWSSELQNVSYRAEIKMIGLVPSGGSKGRIRFLPLPASGESSPAPPPCWKPAA